MSAKQTDRPLNGTFFRWIAGFLILGVMYGGGWFVSDHVAGDTRQWGAINGNMAQVAANATAIESADRRLTELIERQEKWQERCDKKLDALLLRK